MIFQKGNTKIHRSVLCFSLPPVVSCPCHDLCQSCCYAARAYRQYPTVRRSWDRNFDLAKNMPDYFYEIAMRELGLLKQKVIRLHVSGDFFSKNYIELWDRVVARNPDKKFYAYTKCLSLFDFGRIMSRQNFNLINSICEDGQPNFGEWERVYELEAQGYYVCPAVRKVEGVKCGVTCTYCHDKGNDKVVFLQH